MDAPTSSERRVSVRALGEGNGAVRVLIVMPELTETASVLVPVAVARRDR